MGELQRHELLDIIELADQLLDVSDPAGIRPVLLAGLADLSDADFAIWHEIDLRDPVRVLAVGWPPNRFTAGFAQRTAPVANTHPMFELSREWLSQGRPPPAIWRLSDFVSTRQWRKTPLYREALSDVDDQMIMNLSVRGSVLRCLSVERTGRTFSDRDLEVFTRVARPVQAALRRAGTRVVPALQAAPYPAWAEIDPHWVVRAPIPFDRLTARQAEVLALVAGGLTDAQIAPRLAISSRTVSKHLQNAYATLGVTNRVAALQKMRQP